MLENINDTDELSLERPSNETAYNQKRIILSSLHNLIFLTEISEKISWSEMLISELTRMQK